MLTHLIRKCWSVSAALQPSRSQPPKRKDTQHASPKQRHVLLNKTSVDEGISVRAPDKLMQAQQMKIGKQKNVLWNEAIRCP